MKNKCKRFIKKQNKSLNAVYFPYYSGYNAIEHKKNN
jgi:hypothetical protein